jgi:hypothetical protein
MLLMIEESANWIYSLPYSSAVASTLLVDPKFQFASNEEAYSSKNLNDLFKWEKIIGSSHAGAVAVGEYKNHKNIIFKTIDLSKHSGGLTQFDQEVSIYRALKSLQGMCCLY